MRATYSIEGLPAFVHGNPLAEALKPLPTGPELFTALSRAPAGDFERQPDSVVDAVAQLHTLFDTHLPRPEAQVLCGRIHGAIYNLLSRVNPLDPRTYQHISSINARTFGTPINRGSPAPMLLMLGDSGLGKTTLLRGVIKLFPSVIAHDRYQGRAFAHDQVPALTVDAPQGGAITGLFMALAEQLDGALRLPSASGYARSLHRLSIESQKVILARALASHSVSVIHIDDLQRISERTQAAETEAAAMVIGLANSVGALLILSGTAEARAVFTKSFEAGRRAMSLGAFLLQAPRTAADPFYSQLLQMLFRRQLQRRKCVLTSELADTILELTAGNTGITTSLYVACQEACLYQDKEMNADLFRRVRKEQFYLLVPELERANRRRVSPPPVARGNAS
jgi:hypothetical protein